MPPKDSTQSYKFAPHAQLLTDECSLNGSPNFQLGSFSLAVRSWWHFVSGDTSFNGAASIAHGCWSRGSAQALRHTSL